MSTNNKIKVLLCEAGKVAKLIEVEDSYEAMQNLVGGEIEECMPWEYDVCIICNEDGKMLGLSLNRTIKDDNGGFLDVIAGDFFICYAPFESEKFLSLPEDLAEKYMEEFKWPEQIFLRNGRVHSAHKYNPEFRKKEVLSLKPEKSGKAENDYEARGDDYDR